MNKAKKLRILALRKLLNTPPGGDALYHQVPIDEQLCYVAPGGPEYVAFFNRGTRLGWERVAMVHLTITQLDKMLNSLHPGFDLEMWLLQQELSQ